MNGDPSNGDKNVTGPSIMALCDNRGILALPEPLGRRGGPARVLSRSSAGSATPPPPGQQLHCVRPRTRTPRAKGPLSCSYPEAWMLGTHGVFPCPHRGVVGSGNVSGHLGVETEVTTGRTSGDRMGRAWPLLPLFRASLHSPSAHSGEGEDLPSPVPEGALLPVRLPCPQRPPPPGRWGRQWGPHGVPPVLQVTVFGTEPCPQAWGARSLPSPCSPQTWLMGPQDQSHPHLGLGSRVPAGQGATGRVVEAPGASVGRQDMSGGWVKVEAPASDPPALPALWDPRSDSPGAEMWGPSRPLLSFSYAGGSSPGPPRLTRFPALGQAGGGGLWHPRICCCVTRSGSRSQAAPP